MPSELPRVVKPSYPTARPAKARTGVVLPVDAVPEGEFEEPWFTREMLKGWATSIVLHSFLLLVLAFWYFAPKVTSPKVFDGRLAGSERGVEDGLTNTGGLNTTLTVFEAAPAPEPRDPLPAALKPLEFQPIEPKVTGLGSDRATAEGGLRNNNPGAGDGDGFGLARFGQGGESVRGIEVKVGDPQFTLIWDSDADLDLHVIEPGGKEIYWEEPKGLHGGELDVDNTKGFGPENVYWLRDDPGAPEGAKLKGPGPPGEYKWFVVYWGGFGGISKSTHWKVRIKHEGKVTVVDGKFKSLNERSRVHTLTVKPTDATGAGVEPAP